MTTYTVSGNQTTNGPGVYIVTAPNIVLTLETFTHWADLDQEIAVKDGTGSQTPNILITAPGIIGGIIDNVLSVLLNSGFGCFVFRPNKNGFWWTLVNSGGSGGSLGNLPNVQHGDAIPAAGSLFINSSGYVTISQ